VGAVHSDDKGKFNTSIGQELIDAAMKSVDKAKGKPAEVEVEIPIAPAEAGPAPAPGAAPGAPAEASPPAPAAASEEVEMLKMQLEMSMAKGRELMGKVKEEHEKMLRAAADLENYKRRAQKEREETQKFGLEKLLKDLLPVVDNVDRALGNAADLESLKKGVLMIRKLFEDTLSKYGVATFSAVGKAFDPAVHEAMTQAETADMPPNFVHTEVLRGYTLNERLVRPALVVVSKAPAAPAAEATEAAPAAPEDGTKQ
jgi:molecular chaperone GrpE